MRLRSYLLPPLNLNILLNTKLRPAIPQQIREPIKPALLLAIVDAGIREQAHLHIFVLGVVDSTSSLLDRADPGYATDDAAFWKCVTERLFVPNAVLDEHECRPVVYYVLEEWRCSTRVNGFVGADVEVEGVAGF